MMIQKNRMYRLRIFCAGCGLTSPYVWLKRLPELGVEKFFRCDNCDHEYRFNKVTNLWSWEEEAKHG